MAVNEENQEAPWDERLLSREPMPELLRHYADAQWDAVHLNDGHAPPWLVRYLADVETLINQVAACEERLAAAQVPPIPHYQAGDYVVSASMGFGPGDEKPVVTSWDVVRITDPDANPNCEPICWCVCEEDASQIRDALTAAAEGRAVWSREVPTVEGWYWHLDARRLPYIRHFSAYELQQMVSLTSDGWYFRFSGPLTCPARASGEEGE